MASVADEHEFDGPLRSVIEPELEHGESVWAVVHGRDGSALVATDHRILVARERDGWSIRTWEHDALDDLIVIPGGLLVRQRKDHRHVATVPLPREPEEETLQAVTVVALLLAAASKRSRLSG
jgi:hypothetical protein